jgi:hypothetical protein
MSPFNIQRLSWDDFLGNAAVAAAYRDLTKLTKRTVALHPRSLIPRVPQSCYCAWSDAIHIFIEKSSDRVHHSAVHELLHGILVEEGYCLIAARLPESIHPMLTNEMQHPEIFRRMERYGLDMAAYWPHWHNELRGHLDDMMAENVDPHAGVAHMPQLFTWFFFQQVSAPYLAEYREFNPLVYQAAEAAYEAARNIGFADAASQLRSLAIVKDHWARFCADRLPGQFAQDLAANLQAGTVRPMMDFEQKRPATEIMELLKRKGLRPAD